MKGEDYIRKLFPEIEVIKDEKIRKGVINVWIRILDKTVYEKLENVPQNPTLMPKGRSLVEHIKVVTNSAIEIAKIYEENEIKVNLDYLVACCLIHDLDKFLGKEKSLFPHGFLTAIAALEVGLPEEIAHLVSIHSSSANMKPQSPVQVEGLILQHVDWLHVDVLRALYPAEPRDKIVVSRFPSSIFR